MRYGAGPCLNGGMDPLLDAAASARTLRRLGLALLAVAALSALLGALSLVERGLGSRAAVVTLAALLAAGIACAWWLTRGTRAARIAAVALVPVALAAWVLVDNVTGVPLAGAAMCAVVLEFGLGAGIATGLGVVAVMVGLYTSGQPPVGGIVTNLVLTIGMIVLGLLGSALVAQLEQARELAEQAARSRRDEALAELDRTLAADRMEHARTLHDELGQRLTVIGMGLELVVRLRERDPDGAWAEVERSRDAAAEALAELRTLVRALSPLTAEEASRVDLDAALERLAGAFAGTGLDVHLTRTTSPGRGRSLDPLAYRIIQEGLTNVVRHSDARHVQVTLASCDEQVVRVADDGSRAPAFEAGFGLRHLRARVEAAGGTLHAGAGDSGFVLDARYPVPA